jgi:hypothetical protein
MIEETQRRSPLGKLGLYGSILLKWLLGACEDDWIELTRYMIQWRKFVNKLMSLRFPYKQEISYQLLKDHAP